MKLIILLFAIVSVSLGSAPGWLQCGTSKYKDAGEMALPAPSIVGGQVSQRNEFPWQVSLKKKSFLFCGGSIINQNWILTAAHCVERTKPQDINIVVGEHKAKEVEELEKVYRIDRILIHPSYNRPIRFAHDFALLRINGSIELSENVWPVCAPEANESFANYKALVSGWGTLSPGGITSNELRYTTLNITTNQYCGSFYGKNRISDDMICATDNKGSVERDACQGDSGGPLVTKQEDGTFRLIGVVSWGKGCASEYPGVYARVNYVQDWILDNISKD